MRGGQNREFMEFEKMNKSYLTEMYKINVYKWAK